MYTRGRDAKGRAIREIVDVTTRIGTVSVNTPGILLTKSPRVLPEKQPDSKMTVFFSFVVETIFFSSSHLGLDSSHSSRLSPRSSAPRWTSSHPASPARSAARLAIQSSEIRKFDHNHRAMNRNDRGASHSSSEDHPGNVPDHPGVQEHHSGNRKVSGPVGGSQGWGLESTAKKTRNRKPSSCVQCRRKKSVARFAPPPFFALFSLSNSI